MDNAKNGHWYNETQNIGISRKSNIQATQNHGIQKKKDTDMHKIMKETHSKQNDLY